MTTLFTHTAVPLALALAAGRQAVSKRLLGAGIMASVLPDIDGIGFYLGIAYGSVWGHRGLSHSILVAVVVALLAAAAAKNLHSSTIRCFVFVLAAMLSHSILDAFTTGGLGVAFLWPWSSERFFAPVRMIRVSPMHAGQLWSPRGLAVLYSELRWVWLPCLGIALIATATRTFCRSSQNSSTTA